MKLLNDFFNLIEILAIGDSFITTIELNPGHIIYDGHFPGNPVTPGVIQLQLVHELLELHFQRKMKLISMNQCKFLKILNPNETSRLMVEVKFKGIGELLHIEAKGENGPEIFFKLKSDYQFI